jgi:hypothetical protein
MSKATLADWYNSSAWDDPDHTPSVREILEAEGRFLEDTLDYMEREDTRRGGVWAGYDMGDLISHADDIDRRNRSLLRDIRKTLAYNRLCRIAAGMLFLSDIKGDIDGCERLIEELELANRDWLGQ